jgi:hypothetical protein
MLRLAPCLRFMFSAPPLVIFVSDYAIAGSFMKIKTYHNGDDVLVAWKPDGMIQDCRGFALLRRRNGVEEPVSTWVGFEGQKHKEGERRASTNWPIQKYQWTDYMASPGDTLQYRVVPW